MIQGLIVVLFSLGGVDASARAGENVSTQSSLIEVPSSANLESGYESHVASDVAIDPSIANPFQHELAAVDPVTKAKVGAVLLGPVFKASRGAGFDYYRYVTFYNIESRKDRIYSLPVHREQCFDKSEFFGSYTYTYTYTAHVGASLSIEGIGLSSDLTAAKTYTMSRNIRATGNVLADHTPYMIKQSWLGNTYIQTYSKKTRAETILVKDQNKTPWWLPILFPPAAIQREYPFPFEVTDAEWTFDIERTVIKKCSGDESSND